MLRPVDGPMPRGCPRVVLGGPRLVRGTAAWNAPLGTPRRKDSREEGSRGAREPGNAPRGQGLDAELHGGAWYRGPVASVRSAAQTAGRASGVRSVDDDFFSVSCLTASPRFRDVRRPRNHRENGRLDVSRHRSRTSDVELGARVANRRARASSRCLIRARSPSDTRGARASRPVFSRDGRRDARVGRRDAPRLDRRGDDVAIRHLRGGFARGEARGRATRRVAARGAGAPDASRARGEEKRPSRAFARRRRPGWNGEVSRRDDREGHRERRDAFDEGKRERSSSA